MAVFNGTDLLVKHNGFTVAHSISCELTVNQVIVDASTKDSSRWFDGLVGQRDWAVSFDSLIDYAKSIGQNELIDDILNGSTVTIAFTTGVSGDQKLEGSAMLDTTTLSGDIDSPAGLSGKFTGTGALAKSTEA